MSEETERKRPEVNAAPDAGEKSEPADEVRLETTTAADTPPVQAPPAPTPPVPLDVEYEKYLRTALLEQSKAFGTAVLLVSGTALSLSATFVTKATGTFQAKGLLAAAWVLLAVAMAAEVFALLASMNLVTAILESRDDSPWRWVAVRLNWLIATTLVGGFCLLLAFAGCNVWR